MKEPRLRYAQLSVSILGYLRENYCTYLSIKKWCARSATSYDLLNLPFFCSVETQMASSKHSQAMSSALYHDRVDNLAWPFAFLFATLWCQCASKPVTYPTRNTKYRTLAMQQLRPTNRFRSALWLRSMGIDTRNISYSNLPLKNLDVLLRLSSNLKK